MHLTRRPSEDGQDIKVPIVDREVSGAGTEGIIYIYRCHYVIKYDLG
jgi:hypothetical protein